MTQRTRSSNRPNGEEPREGGTCLLVLGMHRSGTSAVTRVLNLLGARLPQRMLGADRTNITGHWEPQRLVEISDRMLAEAGSGWNDWRSLDLAALGAERIDSYKNEIKAVIREEFGDGALFVLKDPRVCRFVPLYQSALAELGIEPLYLLPIRNPLAVIASLEQRDGMTTDFAAFLWLRHVLDAEASTRGGRRCVLTYEDFLGDWSGTIGAVEAALKLEWPRPVEAVRMEVEAFLRPDLQHHAATSAELSGSGVNAWIWDSYPALLQLARPGPEPLAAHDALERIKNAFDSGSAAFGKAAFPEFAIRERRALQRAATREETMLKEIEGFEHEVEALRREVATLREQNLRATASYSALQQEIGEERKTRDEGHPAGAPSRCDLGRSLKVLEREVETLRQQNLRTTESYYALQQELHEEKLRVLKPLYRNTYRSAAGVARRLLPAAAVEKLKRFVRHPDAASAELGYQPRQPGAEGFSAEDVEPAGSESDVFLLSIIDWNFRYQRPQHLASALAAAGRRVFYVEMEPAERAVRVWSQGERLYSVRIAGSDVGWIQPYTGRVGPAQAKSWIAAFYDFCDAVRATPSKLVIIEHPFWWQMARHLPPEFEIAFDCMDDIAGFSNTEPFVLELEEQLIAECDRLIVSSQYLHDKYRKMKTPHIVRNGGDIAHFSPEEGSRPLPDFLAKHSFDASSGRLKVGYVGAIAEWFDAGLLEEVVQRVPEAEFHLCGAVTAERPAALAAYDNVTLYGEVPYSDVPAFLERMDVLLIPFQLLPIIQACDPVKFYEYCAMGKPTVCTRLPELERASHLAFFAASPEEFADQIRNAAIAGKDSVFCRKLREYASENTWRERGEQLLRAIEEHPLVSVVILSYGDPGLTKAAVGSLFPHGPVYPNLEVLVVDNGSPPEALTEIHEHAARFPAVRVLENGENLGFARGNNVGLGAATGDYVMLLNNDTFVTPGSIAALVRHLERNPTLGAVGPLTNNIGNEAKVAVIYSDMDAMRLAARELMTGYRSQLTPVRVAAHFAVMFRRRDMERFGLLPEDYGRGMFEDDDHCEVVRASGFTCAIAEDAFVHHHLSATFSTMQANERQELFERNRAVFERKWGPWQPHRYRDRRPPSTFSG